MQFWFVCEHFAVFGNFSPSAIECQLLTIIYFSIFVVLPATAEELIRVGILFVVHSRVSLLCSAFTNNNGEKQEISEQRVLSVVLCLVPK